MRTLSNRFNSTGIALLLLCAMAGVVPEAAAQFKLPNAATPKLAPAPSAASPVAAAKASKEPRLVDAIIAVVNNEVITRRELIDRSAIIERRLASQGGTPPTRAGCSVRSSRSSGLKWSCRPCKNPDSGGRR